MALAGDDVTSPQTLRFRGHEDLTLVADGWGDPAAAPVVLLHGGGQTRHAWGDTAEALARAGWYALALDLRGHGESDWSPSSDYRVNAFVADLRAVVATVGRSPVLVGASLGGLTALLVAGESGRSPDGAESAPPAEGALPHPSAAALVLVDIGIRVEAAGAARVRGFMLGRPEGFATVEDAADAVAEYLPHRRRPTDLRGLERNLRRDGEGRWRWHWDPSFLTGPRPPTDLVNLDRLSAAARALALPTLLIRGQLSDVLSEEGAREFLALVPDARYVDVSGTGHMVAGDRNDAFTLAVLEFLRDLAGGNGREP